VSIEELADRDRALAGPRQLKEPGSPEWCWQTLFYLRSCMGHVTEQWREAEQIIEELKAARAWKVIPPEAPYGTFDRMLKEELGLPEKEIKNLILKAELASHGGDRKSEPFQADNISLKNQHGTSNTYLRRRLRRDNPDLADLVDSGELSAHAAAVQAGFKPKTFTVRADRPESIVGTLRRQLDPEVLALVTKLLSEGE
jgi:hypothetical protein